MFHCPNCHKLIKNGTRFCPYCGYHINYFRSQAQPSRPAYYPPKRYHYGCGIFFAIIVILIGGAFYFYSTPKGHQTTQQTVSRVTNHQTTNNGSNYNGGRSNNPSNSGYRSFFGMFHRRSNNSNDVNRPGYTLAVMPSDIQGTWYSYDEGKLETLTIGPKSYQESGMPDALTIHPRKKNVDASKLSNHKTWAIALPAHVRGLSYTNILGWNQSAGDGISFAVFNHNGISVLNDAGGAEFDTDANFFRTKAQAKQYKKNIFKDAGEKGFPN